MMRTTQQKKSAIDNLALGKLFARDLVVYAWAAVDGLRIVTIEDLTALQVEFHTGQSGRRTAAQQLAIAKGFTVEHALKQAITACHKALETGDMIHILSRKAKKTPHHTTSKLDHWLVKHKGTMRAVQDIDGQILCILEGLKSPASSAYDRMTLEGVGKSLESALSDAFRQLADSERRAKSQAIQVVYTELGQ